MDDEVQEKVSTMMNLVNAWVGKKGVVHGGALGETSTWHYKLSIGGTFSVKPEGSFPYLLFGFDTKHPSTALLDDENFEKTLEDAYAGHAKRQQRQP